MTHPTTQQLLSAVFFSSVVTPATLPPRLRLLARAADTSGIAQCRVDSFNHQVWRCPVCDSASSWWPCGSWMGFKHASSSSLETASSVLARVVFHCFCRCTDPTCFICIVYLSEQCIFVNVLRTESAAIRNAGGKQLWTLAKDTWKEKSPT